MKARVGLRNARTNVNALQPTEPTKPITRAAIKRQTSIPQNALCKKEQVEDQENELQQMDVDSKSPQCNDSLLAKFEEVGDIDFMGEDWNNCQLVGCYVKDIFSYLQSIETTQQIRPDFLCSPAKLEITPKMHKILFNWLVQVHDRFTLLPETLYLTFHIIDYYMSVSGADIKKSSYQLLGITAMFLASKYEEIYPPDIADFVYLTDNSYTVAQMHEMERKVLSKMEFFLGFPLEIQFIRRYSKVSNASAPVHEMAKYLTELGRSNYQLTHLPPSGLSAAGFCLAAELLANNKGSWPKSWITELEVFSGYNKQVLVPAMRAIASLIVQMQTEEKHLAVKRRYNSRVFAYISNSAELNDADNPVLMKYTS